MNEQLQKYFALYFKEIERCENAGCYWALLHVLLTLPDVCASLESDPASPTPNVSDRYATWCETHLPAKPSISSDDRYQMRNALLHNGGTMAQNRGKTHRTDYRHFSYVYPGTFDLSVHGTTDESGKVLNLHIKAMVAEMKEALESWFHALQDDPTKMEWVEKNIRRLARLQQKRILVPAADASQVERSGMTLSSTDPAPET